MIKIKKNPDLGLLLLRLAVGIIFFVHGWAKFAEMANTIAFFGNLGLPSAVAYLVAAVELIGGLALIIGWVYRHGSALAYYHYGSGSGVCKNGNTQAWFAWWLRN